MYVQKTTMHKKIRMVHISHQGKQINRNMNCVTRDDWYDHTCTVVHTYEATLSGLTKSQGRWSYLQTL